MIHFGAVIHSHTLLLDLLFGYHGSFSFIFFIALFLSQVGNVLEKL